MAINAGLRAEEAVAAYLDKKGFRVLKRNVRYPFGELDIVAEHERTLVFVEVKYRQKLSYGSPFEAVSLSKQRKIILAAKAYLQEHHASMPACRFDVVSLSGDLNDPLIDHIADAFWDEHPHG